MTWYLVDGMDGAGKSTVADYLKAALEAQGRRVLILSNPNPDSLWGRAEAAYLKVPGKPAKILSTLFFIADAIHSIGYKNRRLRQYDDCIFVRYILAVAYLSGSKAGKAYRICERVFPMPDVMIYVDLPPEQSMARIEARGEELEAFENPAALTEVRGRMRALTDGWHVVDNSGTREQTLAQVSSIIAGVHA